MTAVMPSAAKIPENLAPLRRSDRRQLDGVTRLNQLSIGVQIVKATDDGCRCLGIPDGHPPGRDTTDIPDQR